MPEYKLENIQKVASDIHTITIQGATNIAKAACKVMADEIATQEFSSVAELQGFLEAGAKLLSEARATEPQLFNAMKYTQRILQMHIEQPLEEVRTSIVGSFEHYLEMIGRGDDLRDGYGAALINSGDSILTHCHAGSVIHILKEAFATKPISVINTETRPLYQGHRTANDLVAANIPTTMITDSSAAYFLDKKYETEITVNMVLIGCDAIKLDGSIYNKIGSFGIASAAYHNQIPVYIAGNLLKTDCSNTVPIEQRDGRAELRPEAPAALKILDYAFDLVPAEYITGIVTEFGVIAPSDVRATVMQHYPRMVI